MNMPVPQLTKARSEQQQHEAERRDRDRPRERLTLKSPIPRIGRVSLERIGESEEISGWEYEE